MTSQKYFFMNPKNWITKDTPIKRFQGFRAFVPGTEDRETEYIFTIPQLVFLF